MLFEISIFCYTSVVALRVDPVGSAGVAINGVGSTDVDPSVWTSDMASGCQQNWADAGCHWNMDGAILKMFPAVVNLDAVVNQELANVNSLAVTAKDTLPNLISVVNTGAQLQPTLTQTTSDLQSQVTTLASTQNQMNSDIQSSLVSAQNSLKDSRDKFLGTGNYKSSSTGLNTVITDSTAEIQSIADYAAALANSVDADLISQATVFNQTMTPGTSTYAYTDEVNMLSDLSKAIQNANTAASNTVASTSDAIATMQAGLSKFNAFVQSDAQAYVTNNSAAGFANVSTSLSNLFNKTYTAPLFASFAAALDAALNDPTLGINALLAAATLSAQSQLSENSTIFQTNKTALNQAATLLTTLPDITFAPNITWATNQVTNFINAEKAFRTAAATTLGSANATFTAETAQAMMDQAAAESQWQQMSNFITGSPGALSAQLLTQLANIEADSAMTLADQQNSGSSAAMAESEAGRSKLFSLKSTADGASSVMSSATASSAEQLAKIKQLLGTGSSGLSSTMSLLQQFLKGRADAVDSSISSSLTDLAQSLTGISGQVSTLTDSTSGNLKGMTQATMDQASAQLAALQANTNLSAEQLSSLYEALNSGNIQAFQATAAQVAQQQGIALSLTGNAADVANQLSIALTGAKGVAQMVSDAINQATATSIAKIGSLRGTMATVVAAQQQGLNSFSNQLSTAVSTYLNTILGQLTTNTTQVNKLIQAQQAAYQAALPTLKGQADAIVQNQSVWLGIIDDSSATVQGNASAALLGLNNNISSLLQGYTSAVESELTQAASNISRRFKEQADLFNSSVLQPSTSLLTNLSLEATGNLSQISVDFRRIDNMLTSVESTQAAVSAIVSPGGSFDKLNTKYQQLNDTIASLAASGKAQIESGFDADAQLLDALNVSSQYAVRNGYDMAEKQVALVLKNITLATDTSNTAMNRVVKAVRDAQQYDKDYETTNLNATRQGINDTYDLFKEVNASIVKDTEQMASDMGNANSRLQQVAAQIQLALISAAEAGGFSTSNLNGMSEALGFATASSMNSLADKLSAQSSSLPGFDSQLHSGPLGVVGAGSDAISQALLAASGAATAATSAAAAQTSNLVNSLKQTSLDYSTAFDSANTAAQVSQTALQALMGAFASSMNTFQAASSDLATNSADASNQLRAIVDSWGQVTSNAANASAVGMTDLAAALVSMEADVESQLDHTTASISDKVSHIRDDATAMLNAAMRDYANFEPQQQALLNGYGKILSHASDHLNAVQTALSDAQQKESNLETTAKDSSILGTYSTWLTSFQNAVNTDISNIQSSLMSSSSS